MRGARFLIVVFSMALITTGAGRTQVDKHFYNVDKEVTLRGVVKSIRLEPRYEDRAPFMTFQLEERKTGKIYSIEISPAWFFTQDLHQGETVKIIGSLYTKDDKSLNVIARQLQCQGETHILRDKHGFPQWRGGQGKGRKVIRKGKRF